MTASKINKIINSLINGDQWKISSLYNMKNNDYIIFYLDNIYNAFDVNTGDEINDIDIYKWLNSKYKKLTKLEE